MKFDKLIELLKEMETTIEAEENQTLLEKLNREEMINTMQFLQRCAAQAGYYYNLQAPGSEFGTMKLQTAEKRQSKSSLPSEVRKRLYHSRRSRPLFQGKRHFQAAEL